LRWKGFSRAGISQALIEDNAMWMRPARAEDELFLYRLYAGTRAGEFAALGEETAQSLLKMQFQGQQMTYRSQYPGSDHCIVLRNEQSIGRLWIARTAAEHRIVDIALLPEFRNAGIGTKIVKEQMRKAAEAALPLRVSVLHTNAGSLRFHARLGFSVTGRDAVYVQMEWLREAGGIGEERLPPREKL
jgi:GNAT superfamily N-acetyltransferase